MTFIYTYKTAIKPRFEREKRKRERKKEKIRTRLATKSCRVCLVYRKTRVIARAWRLKRRIKRVKRNQSRCITRLWIVVVDEAKKRYETKWPEKGKVNGGPGHEIRPLGRSIPFLCLRYDKEQVGNIAPLIIRIHIFPSPPYQSPKFSRGYFASEASPHRSILYPDSWKLFNQ